jgi:hypothetical protein
VDGAAAAAATAAAATAAIVGAGGATKTDGGGWGGSLADWEMRASPHPGTLAAAAGAGGGAAGGGAAPDGNPACHPSQGPLSRPSSAAGFGGALRQHARLTRGALLRVSGLPPVHAREALLQLLASRGVPCRLALLELSQQGRPGGGAYVFVPRHAHAHSIVGVHHHRGLSQMQLGMRTSGQVTVSLSGAGELRAERHDFLCVRKADESPSPAKKEPSGARGVKGGTAEAERPLRLFETLHEGARVTGSMAGATVEELLDFASDRLAEKRGLSSSGAVGGASSVDHQTEGSFRALSVRGKRAACSPFRPDES